MRLSPYRSGKVIATIQTAYPTKLKMKLTKPTFTQAVAAVFFRAVNTAVYGEFSANNCSEARLEQPYRYNKIERGWHGGQRA